MSLHPTNSKRDRPMIEQNADAHSCSFCDSRRMGKVMDFGEVALAGGFLKLEQFDQEQRFPLRVYFCEDCYAVQVVDKVPPDVLFHNYFYFSSSINTLREHFQSYAEEVTARFLKPDSATVLEFGCNDGVLLRPLAEQGVRTVIGVDPAKNIVAGIDDPRVTLVNDFFTEQVADRIVAKHGTLDMIMANNVYAHIPDIQGTTRAVSRALSDEGVFVFEVHYLGKVVDDMQYDMIYHEHLYYYSLLSAMKHLERYGMMVFDIKPIPIHAGSMRFYVCKNGSRHSYSVSQRVKMLAAEERTKGYERYDTFRRFSDKVHSHRARLTGLLDRLKRSGHRIAGYGASGRANTIIQFCGIRHDHLDYMIDDAPAKIGYYTPGSHFRIFPSSVLAEAGAPDYLLVFAWSFFDEIRKRNAGYLERGGHMILPLPDVTIYPQTG
jgi:methylation protein EvaC